MKNRQQQTTARRSETYILLRGVLTQLAQFRQDLHAVRTALAVRRDRAIEEKRSAPQQLGPNQGSTPAPMQVLVEPWQPLSLIMARFALRLIKTHVNWIRTRKLITSQLGVEVAKLLLQTTEELLEAEKRFLTTDHLRHLEAEQHLDTAKGLAKKVGALLSPVRSEVELGLDSPPQRRKKKSREGGPKEAPPEIGPAKEDKPDSGPPSSSGESGKPPDTIQTTAS